MRIQGEDAPSAGNAGLVDMLSDIFAPSKKHLTEQQQYDERVGRREVTTSGKPLDFGENKIDLVVAPKDKPEGSETTQAPKTRTERPHRKRSK